MKKRNSSQPNYSFKKITGHQTKIEINLANISSSPEDEFKLVSTNYDPHGFDCELCGHKNCNYQFVVKNLKTDIDMKCGSECINHFKGRGVDIDLAEALMKRVLKSTDEARKLMRKELGEAAYEALSPEEKAQIKSYHKSKKIEDLGKAAMKTMSKEEKSKRTVAAFQVIQTLELLGDVSKNKHVLSPEEIQNIVDLGLETEMKKAETYAERAQMYNNFLTLTRRVDEYLKSLREKCLPVEQAEESKFLEECELYKSKYFMHSDYAVVQKFSFYKEIYDSTLKMKWLTDTYLTDQTFKSIQEWYSKHGSLSEKQLELAKKIYENSLTGIVRDQDLEDQISWLMKNKPSSFVESVHSFYKEKGYVSKKQKDMISAIYVRKEKK